MIKITVELLPYGNEINKKILGSAKIWNDGTGTKNKGNYCFQLFGKSRKLREGEIKNFSRLKKHAWYLIQEMLKVL